jgi:hypothetical protein
MYAVIDVLASWLALSVVTLVAWNVVKAAVQHRAVQDEFERRGTHASRSRLCELRARESTAADAPCSPPEWSLTRQASRRLTVGTKPERNALRRASERC